MTENLRKVTSYATKHEAKFMKLLLAQSETGDKRKDAARRRELEAAQKRIGELSKVIETPLKTKNSYRSVAISQDAAEILKAQMAKANDEYVFPSPNGGPISPDSVRNMLHRVLKRARLPMVRFHDLRHPNVKPETTYFLQNFKEIFSIESNVGSF